VSTHCHVSRGTGPDRSVREGLGGIMRLMAPDPSSLLGRAPVPPHVPRPQILPERAPEPSRVSRPRILPPSSIGLQCRHASRGPPWAVNKEI
jgi:hypothetical protein